MFKKIGIASVIVIVAGLGLCRVLSSRILSSQLYSSLEKECPKCTLHFKQLQVSWFPLQVIVTGIEFKGDPTSNPTISFSSEKAESQFQVLSLLQGAPTVELLAAEGLHVTVQERDLNAPSSGPDYPPPGSAFKSFPPARVNKIVAHNSKFTYQHRVHGEVAPIDVQDIDCEVGSFVTRDWLLKEGYQHPVIMRATARLENSGKAEIKVSFDPFAKKNHDEIEIKLNGHKMATLNSFFEVEDGIQLNGVIHSGFAMMSLSEGHLSGTLTASYKDIEFKFKPTPDRGPIESFFSTVMQSVVTSKTRPRKDEKSLPHATISARRRVREPITKLLLRGLEDAAKKILTS